MKTQNLKVGYIGNTESGEEKKQYAQIKLNPFWSGFNESLTDVILFAELKNTHLIEKYKGCGKGYALVQKIDNEYFVTDFSYEEDDIKHYWNKNNVIPCEMSCTQICFCENDFDKFSFIYDNLIKNKIMDAIKKEKIQKEVEKLAIKRNFLIEDIILKIKPYCKELNQSMINYIYMILEERISEYGNLCIDVVQNVLFSKNK